MKNKHLIFLSAFFFMVSSIILAKENSDPSAEGITAASEPTPTPSLLPVATPFKTLKNQNPPKSLIIHKPKPSPSWGKVIQYHRDQILALSEKNRETIHEFVFQDEEGVIRTATFHEYASGEGYWEVWVWDQP